jgi:hypothetical protein
VAKRRAPTFADIGYRNAGIRATARGLKFALGWGLATAELGREPESVEEYAEAMEESRATAFRDQQAFRKAFPKETTPLRMNQVSGAQERYDELYKRLQSRAALVREAQPLLYLLGAALAG